MRATFLTLRPQCAVDETDGRIHYDNIDVMDEHEGYAPLHHHFCADPLMDQNWT